MNFSNDRPKAEALVQKLGNLVKNSTLDKDSINDQVKVRILKDKIDIFLILTY